MIKLQMLTEIKLERLSDVSMRGTIHFVIMTFKDGYKSDSILLDYTNSRFFLIKLIRSYKLKDVTMEPPQFI